MKDKNKKNAVKLLEDWMHSYRVWYKEYVDSGGNPTNPPPPPPPEDEG